MKPAQKAKLIQNIQRLLAELDDAAHSIDQVNESALALGRADLVREPEQMEMAVTP